MYASYEVIVGSLSGCLPDCTQLPRKGNQSSGRMCLHCSLYLTTQLELGGCCDLWPSSALRSVGSGPRSLRTAQEGRRFCSLVALSAAERPHWLSLRSSLLRACPPPFTGPFFAQSVPLVGMSYFHPSYLSLLFFILGSQLQCYFLKKLSLVSRLIQISCF